MKTFVLILALAVAGVAFIAPPLILFLPALCVGVVLMAFPMLLGSMTHRARQGGGTDDAVGRREQRPTSIGS